MCFIGTFPSPTCVLGGEMREVVSDRQHWRQTRLDLAMLDQVLDVLFRHALRVQHVHELLLRSAALDAVFRHLLALLERLGLARHVQRVAPYRRDTANDSRTLLSIRWNGFTNHEVVIKRAKN